MTRVLRILSSPRRGSVTGLLTQAVVDGLATVDPAIEVDTLDLWEQDGPAFGPEHVDAKMAVVDGLDHTDPTRRAWSELVAACERFIAADIYVIGAPMWNGGIPWVLKRYLDAITQPGLLFKLDPETGYHGLLRVKAAVLAMTSSVFRPGVDPAFGVDYHSTYLRYWLDLVGVDRVDEVRVQPASRRLPDLAARIDAGVAQARDLGEALAGSLEACR